MVDLLKNRDIKGKIQGISLGSTKIFLSYHGRESNRNLEAKSKLYGEIIRGLPLMNDGIERGGEVRWK